MQELITQRDAMQVGIAEFDQNEALLLQNEAAYEEGKKALDAKWAELAALKNIRQRHGRLHGRYVGI